ncbi:MAG: cupin domain-containing protein [Patescibacteria group bacterium]
MQILKRQESIEHKNSEHCVAREYPIGDDYLNGALVTINGHYPESGNALNEHCQELAYIMADSGTITSGSMSIKLTEGDMVLISAGEQYYWEG